MVEENVFDGSRRRFLQATGAAGAAATVSASASADRGQETVRLNLGMSNATSMTAAEAAVQEATPAESTVYKREETLGFVSVDVPADAAERVLEDVREREGFRYAEYDRRLHAFGTPDDDLFDEQYAPQQVRAPAAYERTKGSSDVSIAIVDQGVDYEHPDLQDAFGSLKGKDFVNDDDDPAPESASDEYHGTHVAGIASATTDNADGIAGISNSTLLSARALDADGGGSLADIAEAVRWAADQNADIVNMSLGGGGYTDTMKNAVSYAANMGTLPICAAGNDGTRGVAYPAAYSECVAVSAIDENEALASFSQYGDAVDVTAPGVDVLSTWTQSTSQYDGKYNDLSGTSMACPVASGVAALGLAADDFLDANELRARLKNSAVDVGLGDPKQGAGRVDARNIVGEIPPPPPYADAEPSVAPSSPAVGEPVAFDGSESEGTIVEYEWDFGDGATAVGETVDYTYDDAGEYTVSLTVESASGATDTATRTLAVGEPPNEPPTPSFEVDDSGVRPGDVVVVDASPSSDPDGEIVEYEWAFGNASTATGEVTDVTYEAAGEYDISLTVTDDDGATASVSKTVRVEGGGCESRASASASGSLAGWYDDDSFRYVSELDDTCQVTVGLSGPSRADFDLYVTFDGRTPSTYDYDARSITYGSEEQLVVDDVDGDQEFGILVDAYSGAGSFTVSVDEIGN